jgi:hypothetical protein
MVALVSAALLAGCGGKDGGDDATTGAPAAPSSAAPSSAAAAGITALSGPEIVKKSRAALEKAESLHVKGSITDDGEKTSLDLKIAGKDVIGFYQAKEGKIELLSVGTQRFYRPDKKFWIATSGAKQGATVAKVVGDRWVKVDPKDKGAAALFNVTDINKILSEDEGTESVEKGGVTTIDGKQAIKLIDKSEEGGALYVATEGEPYPLRLAGPTAADGGLTFSQYGEKFSDIKVPAAADVFDPAKPTR